MADLNKKALIEKVAEKNELTKKAAGEVIDTIIDEMVEALKGGDKVDLPGFGKFSVKTRSARTRINPLTKTKINIPETKVPGFKAAKALKEAVK